MLNTIDVTIAVIYVVSILISIGWIVYVSKRLSCSVRDIFKYVAYSLETSRKTRILSNTVTVFNLSATGVFYYFDMQYSAIVFSFIIASDFAMNAYLRNLRSGIRNGTFV